MEDDTRISEGSVVAADIAADRDLLAIEGAGV